MPDEPDNLVLVVLRQMRAEAREMRAEQGKRFDQIDKRFEKLEMRVDDTHEAAIFGVGLAAMANRKLDRLADRVGTDVGKVADLEAR